jgi:hypothetical protein
MSSISWTCVPTRPSSMNRFEAALLASYVFSPCRARRVAEMMQCDPKHFMYVHNEVRKGHQTQKYWKVVCYAVARVKSLERRGLLREVGRVTHVFWHRATRDSGEYDSPVYAITESGLTQVLAAGFKDLRTPLFPGKHRKNREPLRGRHDNEFRQYAQTVYEHFAQNVAFLKRTG